MSKMNAAILSEPVASRSKVVRRSADLRISKRPLDLLQDVVPEELFLGMLCLERKRAERSSKPFLLFLVEMEDAGGPSRMQKLIAGVTKAVNVSRRETDLAGWYKQDWILGVIFTELGTLDQVETIKTLKAKLHTALEAELTAQELKHVYVSVHVFSEDTNQENHKNPPSASANPTFYPDLFQDNHPKATHRALKRGMDIVGSLFALTLAAPIFAIVALLVKLSSKGPVFFKQQRLGQFGKEFTCLKFRSMKTGNDPKIHQEFMKQVIGGSYDGKEQGAPAPVFKMTNDPRITGIGRFIRRTSIDELPQFINVLRGDMSLVGPRPPLAYEFEEYDMWHRRRVLEIKPGLTGLWQVRGRSRVRFDDMVRLDLQYARDWSLWLDIKILLETPKAVLMGDGAY
ncbi:MAG TPA: sugar transferase [Dongiaceae bacterium]|nr:sugar transferase [Dongiaceae bacterium]